MARVFIGVGHGGTDSGACANGLIEKNINLVMATKIASILINHNVEVMLSRTTDEEDRLGEEIRECNAFNPSFAVEIHNNAGGGDGFEVLVQTNEYATKSRLIAKEIEAQIKAIGQNSRGIKTRLNNYGTDYFGFLRECNCPSVICEGFFLDNLIDLQIANTTEKQEIFGIAYAKAILNYLNIEYQEKPITNDINDRYTPIMGESICTAEQMKQYLLSKNSNATQYLTLPEIYLVEGKVEGVRGDVAFAQSCLETGYFTFGNDVKAEQNNFCGLGATGNGVCGNVFATPNLGIKAQIQHLQAYATTTYLNGNCVDDRYKYVKRGVAPYVQWLGIPDNPLHIGWAAGKGYGAKILDILKDIQNIKVAEPALPIAQTYTVKIAVQIAALTDKSKAQQMLSDLISKGYDAFIE